MAACSKSSGFPTGRSGPRRPGRPSGSTRPIHPRSPTPRSANPRRDQDNAAWKQQLKTSPVRIQWDPERDLDHTALNFRAIQIGLSGEAVDRYVDEWITTIADVTPVMRDISGLLATGRLPEAVKLVPHEPPYPLSEDLAKAIDATG